MRHGPGVTGVLLELADIFEAEVSGGLQVGFGIGVAKLIELRLAADLGSERFVVARGAATTKTTESYAVKAAVAEDIKYLGIAVKAEYKREKAGTPARQQWDYWGRRVAGQTDRQYLQDAAEEVTFEGKFLHWGNMDRGNIKLGLSAALIIGLRLEVNLSEVADAATRAFME